MTASIPEGEFGVEALPRPECAAAGGVIHTTGTWRNHSGEVRLSGAVDLSLAGEGEVTFSCLFLLDLEPQRRQRGDRP